MAVEFNPEMMRRLNRICNLYQKCKRRSLLFSLSVGSAELGIKISLKCTSVLTQKIAGTKHAEKTKQDFNNNDMTSNYNDSCQVTEITDDCRHFPEEKSDLLPFERLSSSSEVEPRAVVAHSNICVGIEWQIDAQQLLKSLEQMCESSELKMLQAMSKNIIYDGKFTLELNVSEAIIHMLTSSNFNDKEPTHELLEICD